MTPYRNHNTDMPKTMNPLDAFTSAELTAEITRRAAVADQFNMRSLALGDAKRRAGINLFDARNDLDKAEKAHSTRVADHDALRAQHDDKLAEKVRVAEIAVELAHAARVDAKDRLLAAERALEAAESVIAEHNAKVPA